ncbi:protein transport protein Sec61 subunit beta [Phalaenopsis equestris]|uniref:protein transport protein Sec61 subunit beta n=1 Tax=Phalaenopsis equestris TaxID=78828 RepID=UPI0009E49210|nr:protein transport protein Sec61 subunit beta [Phalaenopsis equestris]
MVSIGEAPTRGSAAATASLRRRRTGGGGASAGGAAQKMLQFYTDDNIGLKISPNTVLIMSVGFIVVVALMHVFAKLYLVGT